MKIANISVLLFITMVSAVAFAATHTITFPGFSYSPSTLEVSVGDTIVWEGNFGFHPLKSDVIPNAASQFENETGSTFSYVVTQPGLYTYYCKNHGGPGGAGMAGSFTAVTGNVTRTTMGESASLDQNYPNPASALTKITFNINKSSDVELKVFAIDGNTVSKLASGNYQAGEYEVPFDVASLKSGAYFYRLTVNGEAITRQLIVTK